MAIDDKSELSPSSDHLPHKRIVLFMDILGFRDLITRMPIKPDLYDHMKKLLETIQRRIQNEDKEKKLYPGEDSQVISYGTQFSDSVVLSFPFYPKTCALNATLAVRDAQDILGRLYEYEEGVFARGGIACDWMYHDPKVLLGEGLVAAYKLEKCVARVPRIVVTDEVVKMLHPYVCEKRLRKDSDGLWFVHPFLCLLGELDKIDIQNCKKSRDDVIERSKRTREHVQKWLEQAKSNRPNLLAKYQWLANQFNAFTKEISQSMDISIDPIEVS